MQAEVARHLSALGGRYACIIQQLAGREIHEEVSLYPDEVFSAASLAKVPILVEVAQQVEAGQLTWEQHYPVPADARVPSSGVLADLSPTTALTLRELAHLMITISDNSAANALLGLVGIEAVNETMQRLGLTATRLERFFMDFEARRQGRDNWTTARDMARLLSLLATHQLPEHDVLLTILLRQNDDTMLSAYWNEEIPFAHKTGSLPGILHDAGIVYLPQAPETPEIIVVLTAEQRDTPLTRLTLARIGRLFYTGS